MNPWNVVLFVMLLCAFLGFCCVLRLWYREVWRKRNWTPEYRASVDRLNRIRREVEREARGIWLHHVPRTKKGGEE